MGLIKRPSQLETNAALTALIYGEPGIGKTTLACSAPRPLLFDFDGGATRLKAAHQVDTVQVQKWEEVTEAIAEAQRQGCYDTIIIDTVGKMLAFIEDYIKRTEPKKKKADGSLSLQGYGTRKAKFIEFNRNLRMLGMNVIYVGHCEEKRKGDETTMRPEVGGSSANDLLKELDLVGYMEAYGSVRTITFDPTDRFYAKNSVDMFGVISLPNLINSETGDATGNNDFIQRVVTRYHQRLAANREEATRYEALTDRFREAVAAVEDAKSANDFCAMVKEAEHISNSKAVAGQLISQRAQELGLTFNKVTKQYSDGGEG